MWMGLIDSVARLPPHSASTVEDRCSRKSSFFSTIIEKNELFLLQRSSTVEALCGGNLATESINPIHMGRTAEALEKHYGVPRAALEFYHVHMEVEDEHAARAVTILEKIAVTDEEQSRGRLALRRALTARRICADGMLQAFVGGHDANP